MLATANQLLMASGYQTLDKFGFDADDYAAIEEFLNSNPDSPDDDGPVCEICGSNGPVVKCLDGYACTDGCGPHSREGINN